MADVVSFREAGARVTALAVAEGAVRLHVLPDPEGLSARGAEIGRNLYRRTARVDVPGLGALVLKVHRPHGLADTLRAAVRGSRAAAEWAAGRFLFGAGLPTPEPVLLVERRRGPFLELAASASRLLPGRVTFEPAWVVQPASKARRLLERAARVIRAMHDRGGDHRDLHSGNVLVGHGPGDVSTIDVVDLHKVRVGRALGHRRRAANLAQWLHSLAATVGPGGRLRSLRAYLGPDSTPAEVRAAWGRLGRHLAWRDRRRVRSRSRRCVEEGLEFTRDVGTGSGWRRLDLPLVALDLALAHHDRVLAARGAEVLKVGDKHRVTHDGAIVVKEALAPTVRRRLELALPRRARAGYHNAHGLRVRGIDAAKPLACLRRAGRRFTLYEDLSRLPRLDLRVREATLAREWSPAVRRARLDAFADTVSRLHRRGIWCGDLKAPNWLVEERGARTRFHLVDTDRVRFPGRLSRRRRLRNLAQLHATVPRVAVSRTERLRWFRRYVAGGDLGAPGLERELLRELARRIRRHRCVIDQPFD